MKSFARVIRSVASDQNELRRERLLKVLSAATFLIFFQAYMVAPLIPRLAVVFGISAQQIGLIVPAYLIPYGASMLLFQKPLPWGGLAQGVVHLVPVVLLCSC